MIEFAVGEFIIAFTKSANIKNAAEFHGAKTHDFQPFYFSVQR